MLAVRGQVQDNGNIHFALGARLYQDKHECLQRFGLISDPDASLSTI